MNVEYKEVGSMRLKKKLTLDEAYKLSARDLRRLNKLKKLKKRRVRITAEIGLPTPSPLGPLSTRPERKRVFYDYIKAREYCKRQGLRLQDLTREEMQMFKINAEKI
jgi:hypothetical protein